MCRDTIEVFFKFQNDVILSSDDLMTSKITHFNHFWAKNKHLCYFDPFDATFGDNFTLYPQETMSKNTMKAFYTFQNDAILTGEVIMTS